MVSIESNEDMVKIYDTRKFDSFIAPYYYNIIEESYYPLTKMDEYNAGILTKKRKKYNPKEACLMGSFNPITSYVLKEEKLKEKAFVNKSGQKGLMYSDELSEDPATLSNTNDESCIPTKDIEQIKAIQDKVKLYYTSLVRGNSSIHLGSNGQYLLISSVDGNLYLYSIKHLDICPPKIFKSQRISYYSKAEISQSADFIGLANAEGRVMIWDRKSEELMKVYVDMDSHELNGFSWMCCPEHTFAVGGDDGIVTIYSKK